MGERFHLVTLGCPKNAVDSDKVTASLLADGLDPTDDPAQADLVVVNTCAFVEAARTESIDTALALADVKAPDARLVVTGCMAERYGEELAEALPEADAVVGFAGEGSLATFLGRAPTGVRDLLELPRAAPSVPWAYVKVAEGCDRACAFCAIPSFRGKQRSRSEDSILAEVHALVDGGVAEVVLVAQDLAWYGRDDERVGALAPLLRRLDTIPGLQRIRLLYLYPSEVRDPLVATMLESDHVVPYFDLSLQHAAPGLLRSMKRWGSGERFLEMIERIREAEPEAVFRSSFITGFPGETEDDHEALATFVAQAELEWAGFFPFSPEDGTPAATLTGAVSEAVMGERLRELGEIQDRITAGARHAMVGREVEVLVDEVVPPAGAAEPDSEAGAPARTLVGRTHREAPEIDGVVRIVDADARPGALVRARVTAAAGPDLDAVPVAATPSTPSTPSTTGSGTRNRAGSGTFRVPEPLKGGSA